ncbi:MAG: hypothetical protein ACE366_23050 [Bradymonadia bacterium]
MFRFAQLLIALSLLAPLSLGCGAARKAMDAEMAMKPMNIDSSRQKPAPLTRNVFKADKVRALTEDDLRVVLDAPVFLEKKARIGVVPVTNGYAPHRDLPLAKITADIAKTLDRTELFEIVSEISTDWPTHGNIAGLRELAARYRSEYLLLYRQRFVDRTYTNGWGWTWVTIVGGLLAPTRTLEAAGVMEATLFDVKSGTLLFTVYARVNGEADETVWGNDRKRRDLKMRLLDEATSALVKQVEAKVEQLADARPKTDKAEEAIGAL